MSTLQNRIGVIATQLQQEGKSPSLALVRARLGGGINPAELFSAYQSWRAQGSPLTKPTNEASATAKSPADVTESASDAAMKQDLARIEAKLDLILTLLQEKR
ncbi:MAG: DNA-binding protein [Rheinheimera sp.]|nr:DNA-binding protein [Rheinheimera sp.]